MYNSFITSKGQTTIPSELRNMLNLKPGDQINYIPYNDYIVLVPVNKSIKDLKGILPKSNKSLSLEKMEEIIKGHSYDRDGH